MERIRMKVKIEVALSAEDVLEKLGRKITSDFSNIKVDGENLFELTEYDEIEETEAAKRVRSEIQAKARPHRTATARNMCVF